MDRIDRYNSYTLHINDDKSQTDFNPVIFKGYLRLSDSQILIKPKIYGITSFLVDVGGISKSLYFIFWACNLFVSRELFMQDVLSRLFLAKKRPTENETQVVKE